MNICIFGSTGATGLLLVEQALNAGHKVTAFARSPAKLADFKDRINIIEAELEDEAAIRESVKGQDAILCALGTFEKEYHTTLSDCTRLIVSAMKEHEVERVIAMTAIGCQDSIDLIINPAQKDIITGAFKENWADKDRQEILLEESGLNYTVVRPGGLENKPGTGKYRVFEEKEVLPEHIMIPRADTAKYILDAINDPNQYKKTVSLIS